MRALPPSLHAVRPAGWAVVAAALASLAPSCGPRGDAAPASPPNVILISMDTVRADHLGCYGYDRPTTPRIDALSRKATRYTRSFAAAPWTLPSHASMFTGLYPFEHGAHAFLVKTPRNNAYVLDESHVTLAEALQRLGYHTHAVVANDGYLDPRYRLNQGFETYTGKNVPLADLNEGMLPWIEEHRAERFFLFLNTMDTHQPYNTRPRPAPLPPPPPEERPGALLDELRRRVMLEDGPVPRPLIRQVIDQYDLALANLDEALGELFDRLRALGLWDGALVILTADHGEYFGEHRLVEHALDLYQPALAVPLLVKRPGQVEGSTDDTPISSIHIPHLVAAALPASMRERLERVFPRAPGTQPLVGETYYAPVRELREPRLLERFDRIRTAVIRWPFKYIRSSDGGQELYDLSRDSAERHDLLRDRPALAARLARWMDRAEASRTRHHGRPVGKPLTKEERRRLEELGYL